jgi:hypothetical protein
VDGSQWRLCVDDSTSLTARPSRQVRAKAESLEAVSAGAFAARRQGGQVFFVVVDALGSLTRPP